MLILDLWDINFHAVVVFVKGKDILFKSVLGRCGKESEFGATLLNAIQEDKLV